MSMGSIQFLMQHNFTLSCCHSSPPAAFLFPIRGELYWLNLSVQQQTTYLKGRFYITTAINCEVLNYKYEMLPTSARCAQ